MSSPELIWMLNGQGLGNSTRCLAIMQALPGDYLHSVVTSTPADRFWQSRLPGERLLVLPQARYVGRRDGSFDPWGSLVSGLGLPGQALVQRRRIGRWLKGRTPRLFISDSHYAGRWPPYHLALNSARQVLASYFGRHRRWREHTPQIATEFLDALYHRLVPNEVVAPWFSGPTGLICRAEFRQPCPAGHRLLMLCSGTGLGPVPEVGWGLGRTLEVIGACGRDGPELKFHGSLEQPVNLLREAEVLILHGGLSSISEAIALRKPCLIWPLAGHAEQEVNAQTMADLGLAEVIRGPHEVRGKLRNLLARSHDIQRRYQELGDLCAGADRVARRIQDILASGQA